MGALAATLIPACVGLGLLGLAPRLERRLGAEAAAAFGARAALAAAVLAILLIVQVWQREAEPALRFAWVHVGRTTRIDWLLTLDPLALLLGGVALLGLVLAPVAALAAGPGGGARPHARAGLACGALVLLATVGTLWQAGLAVWLAVLACGPWSGGHGGRDRHPGAWPIGLVGVGLAAAGLAWLVGAGDLELATLERASLGQGGSELLRGRVGGPFLGGAPAVVAAGGCVVAALAWLLAWPRLLARAWGDGPAAAASVIAAAGPAIGVLLLRASMPLALAPTGMAALTAGGAVAAAWAGWRAARAGSARGVVAASGQVGLALAFAAIGVGGFVEAARLLAAHGLATAGLALALACGPRARIAAAGVGAVGLVAAAAGVVAALWGQLSAWSTGINAVAPALALVGLAGLAAGWRRALAGGFEGAGPGAQGARDRSEGAGPGTQGARDRFEGPGWARPDAEPLLAGVALALALAGAAVGVAPVVERLGAVFLGGRLLVGAFALGPRPGALALAPWAAGLLVVAAGVAGAALGPRMRAAAGGAPAGAAPGLWRLVAAADEGLRRLVLWPGDERVAAARRGGGLQGSLLATVAGALAILGSVFCNPDVVVLGPTRIHPVDLGGLDAAMTGARRVAPSEAGSGRPVDPEAAAAEAAAHAAEVVGGVDEAGRIVGAGSAGEVAGGAGRNGQAGEVAGGAGPNGQAGEVAGGAGPNGQAAGPREGAR